MRIIKSFHLYAFITVIFWSLAYVLTRLALEYFSALSLGFLRYTVASITLVPICIISKIKLPKKKDLPIFLLSGISGFFLYMVTFNIGASYVTAATSSVIIASVPIITALLAIVVYKEKLLMTQLAAIVIEFIGILIITMYGAVFSANVGVIWLLFAALLLSLYNLFQRKLTRTYTAIQSTTFSIIGGTFFLTIFAPSSISEIIIAPFEQVVYILILGVFSSALAYVSWAKAFEMAENTSVVSNYMFFTPFITGIMAFFLLGEVPELSTWIGGVFIMAGALLFNRAGAAQTN